MKCLHCRQAISKGDRRCAHCGAPVAKTVLYASPAASDEVAPELTPELRAAILAWESGRYCDCFDDGGQTETKFHSDTQDTQSEGWARLLELVEAAAADGREEFAPFHEMSLKARSEVITLPATIQKLKAVRRLVLYGSCFVRIPPEIGEMENLVEFIPYTSYRLHWFPYEITRCRKLDDGIVSTRALYGNYKFNPPFPRLEEPASTTSGMDLTNLPPERYGAPTITTCSVCRAPLAQTALHQVWISLNVGTDVLPLLVNACSANCVAQLPPAPEGYVPGPHRGGLWA